MYKLLCKGSRPFGVRPVFVLELNRLVFPGEIIEAKDPTFAGMIVGGYPGCFERMEDPVEQEIQIKAKKNQKDKILPIYAAKEFE
jgi:hypothetical protein